MLFAFQEWHVLSRVGSPSAALVRLGEARIKKDPNEFIELALAEIAAHLHRKLEILLYAPAGSWVTLERNFQEPRLNNLLERKP